MTTVKYREKYHVCQKGINDIYLKCYQHYERVNRKEIKKKEQKYTPDLFLR